MDNSTEVLVAESSDERETYTSPRIQKLGRIGNIVEAATNTGADAGIYAS